MDKPELHREDAVFAGVKVGSLWHSVRSVGIFVKGYPDRILALTERGFVWDVHEVAANKFMQSLAAHIRERKQARRPNPATLK